MQSVPGSLFRDPGNEDCFFSYSSITYEYVDIVREGSFLFYMKGSG